jgi:hypothetical protein
LITNGMIADIRSGNQWWRGRAPGPDDGEVGRVGEGKVRIAIGVHEQLQLVGRGRFGSSDRQEKGCTVVLSL